ncbi:MAG: hypothetical protein J7L45_01265 [Candidatus Aenigmarchaeota archaeon]|nr:hypothetical protein [Candidatus Aenigmarchaeota archaeon]
MNISREDDEYEVIPVGPLKKLEERIEKLEKERETVSTHEFIREILDLIESNQKLVDEIVKANDELREELSKIPGKIDELLKAWREFIDLLKEAGVSESSGTEGSGISSDKLDELISLNKEMLEAIKSMKEKNEPVSYVRKYPKIRIRRSA